MTLMTKEGFIKKQRRLYSSRVTRRAIPSISGLPVRNIGARSTCFWISLLSVLLLVLLQANPVLSKITIPFSNFFSDKSKGGNTNKGAAAMPGSGFDIPADNFPSVSGAGSAVPSNPPNPPAGSNIPTTISNLQDLEDVLIKLWERYSRETAMIRDVLVKYPHRILVFVWNNIVMYKPPVGIVAAWAITRLVTSGKIFQPLSWNQGDDKNKDETATSALALHQAGQGSRLDLHTGRALDLDEDDLRYKQYGGIERVRRRLAWSALDTLQEEQEKAQRDSMAAKEERIGNDVNPSEHTTTDSAMPELQKQTTAVHGLVRALGTVLKVEFVPSGSHADHVDEMVRPMAAAEDCALQLGLLPYTGKASPPTTSTLVPQTERLLRISLLTAEVHILDSLLRLTRDQLLRTSFRLARAVKFWRRRVQGQMTDSRILLPFLRKILTGGIEGDRMRLAFAEAAYEAEILQLGKVLNLLGRRPPGMADSNLTLAVQKTLLSTEQLPRNIQTNTNKNFDLQGRWFSPFANWPSSSSSSSSSLGEGQSTKASQGRKSLLSFSPSSFTFPNVGRISNFALRYNVDGRGKFNFQMYDSSVTVGGLSAMQVLLDNYDEIQQPWLDQAEQWTLKARNLIYDAIHAALETSVQPTIPQELELVKLQSTWRLRRYTSDTSMTPESIQWEWTFVLDMIRGIHKLRRVGEGKSLKLNEVNFIQWFQEWDFMGLPSTILRIYIANVIHQKLLPYWPKVHSLLRESFDVGNEIFQTRFWTPFKALVEELMDRKRDKLLTGVSLQDEEMSLDFMLRDLGFGDGTPATRHEAMVKATRQYERDMNSGLMWHALGGRLVRLMLIQVQQLKVGVLDAGEAVDVLFQANRFNIQLLATIPALVIVGVGTKVFLRFLFAFRVKDIRPMSSVHAGMTEYLNDLESLILLTDKTKDQQDLPAKEVLTERQVGEFALILYDYLVLLDYSSPQPFPKWQCDAIHESITGFLGRRGSFERLTLNDQLRLIDLVKRKHQELAKYL